MARYAPEHKEAVRRRMIETAGRRFKADGIDGSGIATLVADAGLTNGAFYGHFASKEDLVAIVVADQLAAQVAAVEALPSGPDSVVEFLREYLSPAHRDDRAGGCPSSALLDEIGRCGEAAREAYTAGAQTLIRAVAAHLDQGDHELAHRRAVGLFTLLVGALQTARAVTDPALSEQILAVTYLHAMNLIGADPSTAPITRQEHR
jgi:TetR/AcrR family transcriptional repressor of nem operon